MSIESMVGALFGGMATKLYAAISAIWVAYEASMVLERAFDPIRTLLV